MSSNSKEAPIPDFFNFNWNDVLTPWSVIFILNRLSVDMIQRLSRILMIVCIFGVLTFWNSDTILANLKSKSNWILCYTQLLTFP